MTTEFQIADVMYGDVAGLGEWSAGHYRQHLRYNAALAARTPPVILPDFPIFYCPLFGNNRREIRFWLDSHEKWHELLRPIANITSADFSDLDLKNQAKFYDWLDLHFAEHELLDTRLGV